MHQTVVFTHSNDRKLNVLEHTPDITSRTRMELLYRAMSPKGSRRKKKKCNFRKCKCHCVALVCWWLATLSLHSNIMPNKYWNSQYVPGSLQNIPWSNRLAVKKNQTFKINRVNPLMKQPPHCQSKPSVVLMITLHISLQ